MVYCFSNLFDKPCFFSSIKLMIVNDKLIQNVTQLRKSIKIWGYGVLHQCLLNIKKYDWLNNLRQKVQQCVLIIFNCISDFKMLQEYSFYFIFSMWFFRLQKIVWSWTWRFLDRMSFNLRSQTQPIVIGTWIKYNN